MADENIVLTMLQGILRMLTTIAMWLAASITGCVRAVVPCGWLSRKDVRNKVVLITGAGSGLGRLMALRFAALGAKIVLLDVNEKGLSETGKIVMANHKDAQVYEFTCNVADVATVKTVCDAIKTAVGHVDILINNAGIVSGGRLEQLPDHKIELTMHVNVMAHFWLLKAFLPGMLERKSGHVVTVASGAGLFGAADLVDYCASKFAAVGLHEALAVELHSRGCGHYNNEVFSTLICPFFINTGMFDGVTTGSCMLPILEADYAVDRIMEAILTNAACLLMPKILYVLYVIKAIMPTGAGYVLADYFGVTRSMDHFKGRQHKRD